MTVPQDTPPPTAVSTREKDPAELYREGLGLKEAGLYREALKKFEAAEGNQAYRFKASAQKGFCLRAIGKLDDAVVYFAIPLPSTARRLEIFCMSATFWD